VEQQSLPVRSETPTAWEDPEFYAAFEALPGLYVHPLPAVLDTSCVRTALAIRLQTGTSPPSLAAIRAGAVRLFMDTDTLEETYRRLPRFAKQLQTPLPVLVDLFESEWLPHIHILAVPSELRSLDPRARAVHDRDPDDYPVAALAALLSPCVLLTHNYRHFSAVGVSSYTQGTDALFAAVDLRVGETRLRAVASLPAAPVVVVKGGVQWANERMGYAGWVTLAVLLLGAVVLYNRQTDERKAAVRQAAADGAVWFLQETRRASLQLDRSRRELDAHLVPGPDHRSPAAAVMRQLALADDSMSAQQLIDALSAEARLPIGALRRFLRANTPAVFSETRRGSFELGAPASRK